MRKLRVTLLLVAASLAAPGQAAAQCRALVQGHIDFLAARDGRVVSYKMTTNRADGKLASFTEGTLKQKFDLNNRPVGITDVTSGGGVQLFSDRLYTHDEVRGCTLYSGLIRKPFDGLNPDRTLVEVLLVPGSERNAVVNTTLLSWGSVRQSFPAECRGGLVFGFADNIMFTLSFERMP